MQNVYTLFKKNYILLLLLCLSTFNTTPIADIKTNNEVLPALINGNGKPVGGIEPDNISYCTINLNTKKRAIIIALICL